MTHIPMVAPEATSKFPTKEKRPDIQKLPIGTHPAIIQSIVNIGTLDDEYQGQSRKRNIIKFTFEFPMHKQLFYVTDTVATPSVLTKQETYVISNNKKSGKKSNLLLMIESLEGPLPEAKYKTYDISTLLDRKVFVNITHYQKKDNKGIGAKISGISAFNPLMVKPEDIVRTNPLVIYHPGMGFDNIYFAKLQYYDRQDVKSSYEGRAHASAGGKFSKLDENGNVVLDDDDSVSVPTMSTRKVIMLDSANSYDAFKSAGWTDEALVQNGYGKYEEPTVPAPQPVQQVATPLPPTPPTVQAPPTVVTPTLKMIDTSATYEAFIQAGWTDALLVQHGKAIMETPVQVIAPPILQGPPPPVAAVSPEQAFAQAVPQQVQQIPAPTPAQAIPSPLPPIQPSGFEVPAQPSAFSDDDAHDDLPF